MAFLPLFLFSLLVSTTLALNQEEVLILNAGLQYKKLNLTVYFKQEPATTVTVADPNPGYKTPTNFGRVDILDAALLTSTLKNASIVGRWQGVSIQTDTQIPGLFMTSSIVSNNNTANTLLVMGRQDLTIELREFSIIGGTGKYERAQGSIYGKMTSSLDKNTWMELHIIALYPKQGIRATY